MQQTNGNKVLVALSGGVDSSVSAALLQEQGHKVSGAFIKTWNAPWLPCTWKQERDDAGAVADQLGIPFETVDLSLEYERDVVQYLVREYKAGRTPNPDVMCNKYIKFGGLYTYAMEQGFDYVATGHYARIGSENGCRTLVAGTDRNKDQSYFLWTLTHEHLSHTLFPVGEFVKKDVRELARHFGLPTATKKDSQGVCFLGQVDMKEFLSHYVEPAQGAVLNRDGEVVGHHDGALFFTLGQRHGFSVTPQSPDNPPLYVVAKDVTANTITVAPRLSEDLDVPPRTIELCDTNWFCGLELGACQARLRYRQQLFEVEVEDVGVGTALVRPLLPQRYVPAGQSMVLYDGDRCLGGGVIR